MYQPCENALLHQRGADAAGEVVEQETCRPHDLFDGAPEDKKGEHVEKQVAEAAMEEHVGDKLVWLEARRGEVV